MDILQIDAKTNIEKFDSNPIDTDHLLFDNDPNESTLFQYDLIRTELNFKDFLTDISKSETFPISISLMYMAKKWMLSFLKNFIEIAYSNQSLKELTLLRISNSNIPNETLFPLLKSLKNSLIELNLSSNPVTISDDTIYELMKLDTLKNLKTLILKNNKKITDKTLENLSMPQCQFTLKCLNMSNCSITDQGLKFMNNGKNFQYLEILNISRNHEIEAFDEIYLPNLKELEAAYCKLQADFVKNIIKSGYHLTLKTLNIGNLASYDPKSVFKTILKEFLKLEGKFLKLEKLSLENVCIEDEDLEHIYQIFPNMQSLNLNNNKFITNKCLGYLEKYKGKLMVLGLENCQINHMNIEKNIGFSFEKLIYLNLNNNGELLDKGLSLILSKVSKNLKYLFCANCNISSDICNFFKENEENFMDLQFINIRGNHYFRNAGMKFLSECKFFKKVKFLNVSECDLDDNVIGILLENKEIGGFSLKDFRVAQNKITPDGMKKLFGNHLQDFKYLEKFAMGSYECMDDFEGKNELEQRGIIVVPIIGDNLD